MFTSNSSSIGNQFSIANPSLEPTGILPPLDSNPVNIALTDAQSKLQKFFASPSALEKLEQVFDITDQNAADILIKNSAAGIFEQIPHLQTLNDSAMNGALGAFSQATNTIYSSDSLVRGDSLKLEEVLLEELAHKFDTLLNPGGDTPGDEGELFKDIVLGLPLSEPELLRIKTENDFGTVVIDNQVISVEQSYNSLVKSSPGLTKNIGGWTDNNTYPRVSGDVNGDGQDDIIGFGASNVFVSLSNGNGTFGAPIGSTPSATNGFTTNVGGWTNNNTYPRVSGDVNGDGKDDIIGFGSGKVYVSLSNGNGTFGAPIGSTPSATNGFTTNVGGWTDNNTYPRVSGDVNGDGKDDIVGFGSGKVYVSLSNGNGTFGSPIASTPSATNGFTKNVGGWTDNNNYPRVLGDVNGDGKDDIVGFGASNVFVSLSNGNGTFGSPIASTPSSTNGFTKNVGGWTDNNNYPRVLADVNGDGKDDIVGFGATNVFVSLSNGNGTFGSPMAYSPNLTKNNGGWTDNNNYPRVVGDVNKDGKDDLIGFGASDVFVSLSGSNVTPPPPPPGKYQLPYPDGTTYKVNAGNNNGDNHSDQWNSYAWDFDMPEGSTVVATRGGKVISSYEGSNTNLNSKTGWATYTNYVLIDHGDGTSALYAHLKYNSVLPNVGDYVSQNQPIAQSGNTGYSFGRHLHYSVEKTPSYIPAGGFSNKSGNYWTESLPSSFSDPNVLSKNSNGVPTYPNNYTS